MSDDNVEMMWQGRFITAKREGKWEYVSRARDIRAAVIVAVEDGEVILVEQYRVPLGRNCLELPAGLVGDETAGESAEDSAARELEEETGYRAAKIDNLGEFYSSPGLVTEGFTLVRASGLTKVGEGGGTPDENIVVHRVALSDLPGFVQAKRDAGVAIDVKMLLLLSGTLLG